jgi:pectate lyase
MRTSTPKRRRMALFASATALLLGGGLTAVITATNAQAAVGCQVTYQVSTQWPGGFTANVTIQNLGDPINGWTLRWTFSAGQTVAQAWNADVTLNTTSPTATNASWNAAIPTNGTASFGFNGTWNNSSNPAPTPFTLNGTTCTGGVSNPPTTPSTPPTTPTTTGTTTSPPPPPPPNNGLIGWATQGGGTTGGASGPVLTVTSLSAMTTAASATTAQTIRVSGNFTCTGDVRVASNKTILGVGASSGLTGCGLNLRDSTNIIVRNLRISFVQASSGNGDAIHLDHSTRVWIDHNDLFSDITHGTDFYDGLLDITHASDFVTVSWNRLHDHIKCSLIGHSDTNAAEDTGHLRVTYHHNWFNNCDQRNPRIRFGNPVHVLNNYYLNIPLYGVASTENGGALIEANYFENVPDPFHQGQADSGPGGVAARNNIFVNSGPGQTGGSVAAIPYPYTVETASTVKASVMANSGTGKIST